MEERSVMNRTKVLTLIAVFALALGGLVGGTVAWLSDTTDTVTNTFTYGDISIGLTETDTELDGDDDATTNDYKMVPGSNITKDPILTVNGGSEKCWLFVKLEKTENFDDFLTFELAQGWESVKGVEGVYYRIVDASAADQSFGVLVDNIVTVKSDVTKDMLNALDIDPENTTYPQLFVTGYAVQFANIDTPEQAWSFVAP